MQAEVRRASVKLNGRTWVLVGERAKKRKEEGFFGVVTVLLYNNGVEEAVGCLEIMRPSDFEFFYCR